MGKLKNIIYLFMSLNYVERYFRRKNKQKKSTDKNLSKNVSPENKNKVKAKEKSTKIKEYQTNLKIIKLKESENLEDIAKIYKEEQYSKRLKNLKLKRFA